MSTKENPFTEQIMRCSSLQKFPLYPQGVKELRDTLRKHSQTLDRAVRVIDLVMAERDTCPTPKELAAIANEMNRQAESVPGGCEICEGQPWVTVEKLVWEFPKGKEGNRGIQYMAAGSERCHCTKGQWFRAKDKENAAKRAAGQPV